MSLGQYMASFRSILKRMIQNKSGHRDKDPLNSSKRQIMTKLTHKTMLHLHALFVKNCPKWIGSINALRPLQLRVPNPLKELYNTLVHSYSPLQRTCRRFLVEV